MNTDVMFSSKTDLWETPQEFFDKLDAEFHFNLDVCATPENTKCAAYYTPEMDGLSQPWYGRCWCNPPYGRQVGRWVEKAASGAALASGAASARGAASASGAASARGASSAMGAALKIIVLKMENTLRATELEAKSAKRIFSWMKPGKCLSALGASLVR